MRLIPVLAIAVSLAAPAARAEVTIAPAGPCAVAPQRDPCAEGSCAKSGAKARGRFSPDGVASDGRGISSDDLPPAPATFDGPGSCADPSTGCGKTPVVIVNRFQAPSPAEPELPAVAPAPHEPPPPPTPPAATPPVVPPAPPVVTEPPPGPVLPPGVPTP